MRTAINRLCCVAELAGIKIKSLKLDREQLLQLNNECPTLAYLPSHGSMYYMELPLLKPDGSAWLI